MESALSGGYAGGMKRRILHVDMDEFFAAVEKLDHPELRGKCLLIGGDPRARGVVSTASYEARAFGCHSAMPMAQAVRLCPHAIVLPGRHQRYRQASEQVFDVLESFTPLIEPLSIDEAFLDVTGCRRLFGPAEKMAREVKRTIASETNLIASVGVAPNKFLAKLASDLDKPDGLTVITESNVHQVLDPLPIRKLWGVGPAAAGRLEQFNLRTIGQIRAAGKDMLRRHLGSLGEHLHELAHGRDDRPVTPDGQAKSIGQEQTFAVDIDRPDQLRRILLGQVEQVARRLRKADLQARTVTLKLRYGDFTTLSRGTTLSEPTNVTEELWKAARGVFDLWLAQSRRPLRLLGMTASQLLPRAGQQLSLFSTPRQEKQQRLDQTLDAIHGRFGEKAVRRGGSSRNP